MPKVIEAFREAPLSDRLQKRVDQLIAQFHSWDLERVLGQVQPSYEQMSDRSETKIQILVDDD